MNCSKCGATLREGARFCSACGFDASNAAIGASTLNAASPDNPQAPVLPDFRQVADSQGQSRGAWPQPQQSSPGQVPQTPPGYQGQVQPGYTPQGQPGYPPQGQSGYPPQGQSGYPPQGQSGYTPQGQSGYPPQGQSGYPPQGQPGYPPQGMYPSQGLDPYGQPAGKKRRKGGCLGFLLILVLLAVVLCGAAYAGYQTFLPAKWIFGVAELNTINSGYDDFDAVMDRFEATRLKPVMEQPFSQDIEMGVQFDATLLEALGGMDAASAQQTADLFKSLAVKVATSSDLSRKTALVDLSLFMKDNPFLDLNLDMNGKVVGLKLPDLSATRIVGDLSDPAVMQRMSSLSGSASADSATGTAGLSVLGSVDPWTSKAVYDKVGIDRVELKKLVLNYALAVYNALPASSMTIDRSVEVEVLGKKQNLKEITIDMTPEQYKAVIIKIMEKIENDDQFYKLFIDNYDRMLQIMGESSPDLQLQYETMRDGLTRDAFRANVAKAIKDYEAAEIVVSEGTPDMVVKVYIDGINVVRHSVNLADTTGGDGKVVIGLDRVKQGEKISSSLNVLGGGSGQSVKGSIDWSTEYKESTKTHNFMMAGKADLDVTGTKGTLALTLNSFETPGGKNTADRKVDGLMRINLTGDTPLNLTMDIKGGGPVERDADGKETSLDQSFDVSVQTDGIPAPIAFKATIKTQYEYGKSFSLPAEGAVLDLATATEEDMGAYVQEISPKLQELLATLVPAAQPVSP